MHNAMPLPSLSLHANPKHYSISWIVPLSMQATFFFFSLLSSCMCNTKHKKNSQRRECIHFYRAPCQAIHNHVKVFFSFFCNFFSIGRSFLSCLHFLSPSHLQFVSCEQKKAHTHTRRYQCWLHATIITTTTTNEQMNKSYSIRYVLTCVAMQT